MLHLLRALVLIGLLSDLLIGTKQKYYNDALEVFSHEFRCRYPTVRIAEARLAHLSLE